MDVHRIEGGVAAGDVAEAHRNDLETVHREAHGLEADEIYPVSEHT